jgi:hypothetical protein
MKRLVFFALLFARAVLAVSGMDIGLTFHQNPEWEGAGGDTDLVYAGGLGPWVSASPRENVDIYFSGNIAVKYENETWKTVPEVTLFMVSWRPLPVLSVDAGRIRFSDFNRVLAAGLFDGVTGACELGSSRLSLGAYYTGLLYKDTADIFMTTGDAADYVRELDYDDFDGTYFASRRFFAVAGWEIPSLAGSPHGLFFNGIAQFDLNERDEKIHTQYLSVRFLYSPVPSLDFSLGGIAGLAERTGAAVSADTKASFALLAAASWKPPSAVQDSLTLAFRWGSGQVNERIGPFRPITTITQGNVLDTGLAGLMVLSAAYAMRPVGDLVLNFDARYFLRSDVQTYTSLYLKRTDEKALGAELYAAATWVPVVDISLIAGGGAFFPGMGNALDSGAPVQWKTALALLLSF